MLRRRAPPLRACICLDEVQRLLTGWGVQEEMRLWPISPPANSIRCPFPALSNEARDAVNAAFDAMSTWRTETVDNSEKNLEQVIEKMAAAARALGWPEQIVDATRSQMQSVTKTQIQMMDQMVDAWEEQIKSPNPSAMLSKLNSLSGFGPAGTWPNAADMSAMNPMQFFMQFMEQWQKVGRTRWRFGPRLPARSVASDRNIIRRRPCADRAGMHPLADL